MSIARSLVLKASLLSILVAGVSYADDKLDQTPVTEIESNYVISPRGCMGLNENEEKDGLMMVLTFEQVGKSVGDSIVADGDNNKMMYLVVPCKLKSALQKCNSARGLFKVSVGSGLFSLPESKEFICVNSK